MKSSVDRLIQDYKGRLADYEVLISSAEDDARAARHAGIVDPLRRAEVRRLTDLRQLCYQVLTDLESMRDDAIYAEPSSESCSEK